MTREARLLAHRLAQRKWLRSEPFLAKEVQRAGNARRGVSASVKAAERKALTEARRFVREDGRRLYEAAVADVLTNGMPAWYKHRSASRRRKYAEFLVAEREANECARLQRIEAVRYRYEVREADWYLGQLAAGEPISERGRMEIDALIRRGRLTLGNAEADRAAVARASVHSPEGPENDAAWATIASLTRAV